MLPFRSAPDDVTPDDDDDELLDELAGEASAGGEERFEIGRDHKGLSVLDFLDAVAGPVDRRAVAAAARHRRILLNGEPTGPAATLTVGDVVELEVPHEELARHAGTPVRLVHAGDELLVGSKPSGLPFDAGRRGGRSALDELAALVPGDARPRPVHRLDKDTSGLVVTALGRAAEERLADALAVGEARVEYLALVRGAVTEPEGVVDVPLGKVRRSHRELVPDEEHGAPCATGWTVEERLRGFTLLRLVPRGRGRSHQVRAHLAAWGRPALCDQLYGEDDRVMLSQLKLDYRPKRGRPERPLLARPAVHAERFVWGELELRAPLPEDLGVLMAQLRRLFALS